MEPRYKIGMRTIKTVVAVGICLLVFQFLLPNSSINGIQAAMAATICMKSSLQNTLRTGLDRTAGTVMGSVMGVLFLLLSGLLPVYLISAISIVGVLLIIYFCNVFRLQASVTISIVVFLIILIGERDIPPVYYGLARLGETIFGIFVAYIINRFLDIRKKRVIAPVGSDGEADGIREATDADIGAIMQIWLRTQIAAHPFIDEAYWHSRYDDVRAAVKAAAHTAVSTEKGSVRGVISVTSQGEIIALCVTLASQHQGRGIQLVHYAKHIHQCLTIQCMAASETAVKFLINRGFVPTHESQNTEAGCAVYTMAWSAKNKPPACS